MVSGGTVFASVLLSDVIGRGGKHMRSGCWALTLALGILTTWPLFAQGTATQDPAKMPKAEVAKIQKALEHEGYNPGSIDGNWGPESEQALKEFQANRALPTSHGQIDSMTLHALHVVSG